MAKLILRVDSIGYEKTITLKPILEEGKRDIIVTEDGIVSDIRKNNLFNRYFDSDGNELFFNDPSIDLEYKEDLLIEDRLYFFISNSELKTVIRDIGGIDPLIHRRLTTPLTKGASIPIGAWISAAIDSHRSAYFTMSYLVGIN